MSPDTLHAPAERAGWEMLHQQLAMIGANRALQGSIFTAAEPVLLLNTHRQIVYANAAGQQQLCPGRDPATLYACRPGEVMQCVYAAQGAGGCGTSLHCRTCGAVNAVLQSLGGRAEMQPCSIQTWQQPEPLDFTIFSMPLNVDTESCALVTMLKRENKQNLAKNTFAMQRMSAAIENC